MSISLVSKDTVKLFLDIALTDTNYDSLIITLIQLVSDRIQLFLNRELAAIERIDYFEAGRRKYYVSAYPILNPTTLTVALDTNIQTNNEEYFVREDVGLIEFEFKTCYVEPKEIKITYIGGYTETLGVLNVPDALKYACLLQTAFVFRRRKDIGMNSISMPDGSMATMFSGDLLPEVKNVLKGFRKSPGDN